MKITKNIKVGEGHFFCTEGKHLLIEGRQKDQIKILLPLNKMACLEAEETGTNLTAAAKSLQLCLTLRPHRWQPISLPHPWDSPGKKTGVGCHFLLQCMKVKSESEVPHLCPTLSDPMDCSLPGSSVHGIFQARVLEWCAIAFSVILIMFIVYYHVKYSQKPCGW